MKDIVLFCVSFYLLKQDVARVLLATKQNRDPAHGSIPVVF